MRPRFPESREATVATPHPPVKRLNGRTGKCTVPAGATAVGSTCAERTDRRGRMTVFRTVALTGASGARCCQNQPGKFNHRLTIRPCPPTSPATTVRPRGSGMVLLRVFKSAVADQDLPHRGRPRPRDQPAGSLTLLRYTRWTLAGTTSRRHPSPGPACGAASPPSGEATPMCHRTSTPTAPLDPLNRPPLSPAPPSLLPTCRWRCLRRGLHAPPFGA
jgi:hypothetical protein